MIILELRMICLLLWVLRWLMKPICIHRWNGKCPMRWVVCEVLHSFCHLHKDPFFLKHGLKALNVTSSLWTAMDRGRRFFQAGSKHIWSLFLFFLVHYSGETRLAWKAEIRGMALGLVLGTTAVHNDLDEVPNMVLLYG